VWGEIAAGGTGGLDPRAGLGETNLVAGLHGYHIAKERGRPAWKKINLRGETATDLGAAGAATSQGFGG